MLNLGVGHHCSKLGRTKLGEAGFIEPARVNDLSRSPGICGRNINQYLLSKATGVKDSVYNTRAIQLSFLLTDGCL